MQLSRFTTYFLYIISFSLLSLTVSGQLGFDLDIKKPKPYEDRELKAEKTGEKKFTKPRRLVQNAYTHYNYFFNANNKLNEVIARAKEAYKDDYSQLISFYNYTLEATAADKRELDSIIYKSQTGIVLHDLRNDWADNLYLLWGAAYYLRKDFDSARLMFQFINYSFADKEKDGYYRFIGSRLDGNSATSIATKEKNSLTRRIFSEPPSRNDAFIWQIRNYLVQDRYAEATSLIETLKEDPAFPGRLRDDLAEVEALMYYKQKRWDSAALYLSRGLENAPTKQERTRWEFLTAQLYEKASNPSEAESYYQHVIRHTTDPVMEIYARLYSIRNNQTAGEDYIARNIAELEKMARRDKYRDYRDIIYYMAARMELQRHNNDEAYTLLLKSIKYPGKNAQDRNRAYLALAELAYDKKRYRESYNFYDSLKLDPRYFTDEEINTLNGRKSMLGNLSTQIEIVIRQDSLQQVAAMPEDERKDYIRKLVRRLRKLQGLGEEEEPLAALAADQPTDLFGGNNPKKGEWYFYNADLKSKGRAQFRASWGNRPNVDNWRRKTAVAAQLTSGPQNDRANPGGRSLNIPASQQPVEITYDALYEKLPLTEEQLKTSNDSIRNALFEQGRIYADEVEDCASMIDVYETLRKRFPGFEQMDEVLFRLYYCYHKTGNEVRADSARWLLNNQYAGSKYASIATTGQAPPQSAISTETTRAYEDIYELFIEGRFDEAMAKKRIADQQYGKTYWNPQLSYIEAVYHIRQQEDSVAKEILNEIIDRRASSGPLADKATTMLDVLNRRAQIEEELRNLQVQPRSDTTNTAADSSQLVVQAPPRVPLADNNQPINPVSKDERKQISQPVDTVARKPVIKINNNYAYNPTLPQYAVVILNKVDIVFGNEAKNAFFRYNRQKFYNKQIELQVIDIDSTNKFLLAGPFPNEEEAIKYLETVRPVATTEVIPWLKPDKYTFSIISEGNLEILKSEPDLKKYKLFLEQYLPGKF